MDAGDREAFHWSREVEASHEIHSDDTGAVQAAVDDVLSRATGS